MEEEEEGRKVGNTAVGLGHVGSIIGPPYKQ